MLCKLLTLLGYSLKYSMEKKLEADSGQRVQERLLLSELIRIVVGRQEDLRLLQSVRYRLGLACKIICT